MCHARVKLQPIRWLLCSSRRWSTLARRWTFSLSCPEGRPVSVARASPPRWALLSQSLQSALVSILAALRQLCRLFGFLLLARCVLPQLQRRCARAGIPGFAGPPAVGVCTEDSMQSLNNVPPDLLPGTIESLPSECRTCVAILSLSCSSSDGLADDLSTCMMQCMIGMSQLFVSLCCFALLSTLFREHRCAALLT